MALEGSLQDMSLVDLFQVFRMGPKTGVLLLVGGLERGVIYVAEGRLVDAAVVRGTERKVMAAADEAVLQLLQWENATFTFRADHTITQRPVRIVQDHETLIVEGLRRRSTFFSSDGHQHLSLDTHIELASLSSSAENGLHLDLDQWRLLSQVSTSRSLREVSEMTGIAPNQALRIASELLAIGLIDISAIPRPVAPRRSAQLPSIIQPTAGNQLIPSEPQPSADNRGLLKAIMRRIRGL